MSKKKPARLKKKSSAKNASKKKSASRSREKSSSKPALSPAAAAVTQEIHVAGAHVRERPSVHITAGTIPQSLLLRADHVSE
jgi:hypothetical protein